MNSIFIFSFVNIIYYFYFKIKICLFYFKNKNHKYLFTAENSRQGRYITQKEEKLCRVLKLQAQEAIFPTEL